MKGVDILGTIMISTMVLLIIGLVIFGFTYNSGLKTCENKQSPFCYSIQCPCDIDNTQNPPVKEPPCFGYAKMPAGGPNRWYCSNATNTVVDDNGKPVT